MKKSIVCALSAVLIGSMLSAPIEGHASTVNTKISAETNSAEDDLVGGFTRAKSPKLTKARRKLFKKAFKNFVGSKVTPVAYLASQVVAGTNHLYLCRIKAVVPNAQEYYCFVTIYEDLDGNVTVSKISTTDAVTKINELPGGWFQSSSAKVSKGLRTALDDALMGLVGVGYTPVAVLSQQVVAGMNYCLLCESRIVYPGAPVNYSLVYLYVGLDGKSEITDIARIADGAGNAFAELESYDDIVSGDEE